MEEAQEFFLLQSEGGEVIIDKFIHSCMVLLKASAKSKQGTAMVRLLYESRYLCGTHNEHLETMNGHMTGLHAKLPTILTNEELGDTPFSEQ